MNNVLLQLKENGCYGDLIKYIDNDITLDLVGKSDIYKLYIELNKFSYLVFENKKDLNKLLTIIPILTKKTFLYSELNDNLINKMLKTIDNKTLKKFKTATCTVIKDEHQYLEEWIIHNLNIGFDEIWLYEDYGSISHKSITDKFPQVHLNKLSDIKIYIKKHKQTDTWNYFIKNHKKDLDWVAFIDIDEFIVFDEGWDLQRLLNEYKGEEAIYLFWKMFNANGYIDKPEIKSVVEAFTEECDLIESDKSRWCFKSVVNLKRNNMFITNHETYFGVSTNSLHGANNICYEKSWINHYFTKSWEEWCFRFIKRGDVCKDIRKIYNFFACNKNMETIKDELKDKYVEYEIKYLGRQHTDKNKLNF